MLFEPLLFYVLHMFTWDTGVKYGTIRAASAKFIYSVNWETKMHVSQCDFIIIYIKWTHGVIRSAISYGYDYLPMPSLEGGGGLLLA